VARFSFHLRAQRFLWALPIITLHDRPTKRKRRRRMMMMINPSLPTELSLVYTAAVHCQVNFIADGARTSLSLSLYFPSGFHIFFLSKSTRESLFFFFFFLLTQLKYWIVVSRAVLYGARCNPAILVKYIVCRERKEKKKKKKKKER